MTITLHNRQSTKLWFTGKLKLIVVIVNVKLKP